MRLPFLASRRSPSLVAALLGGALLTFGPAPARAQSEELLNPSFMERLYAAVVDALRAGEPAGLASGLAPAAEGNSVVIRAGLSDGTLVWRPLTTSPAVSRISLCTGSARAAFACAKIERELRAGQLTRSATSEDFSLLSRRLGEQYRSSAVVQIPKSAELLATRADLGAHHTLLIDDGAATMRLNTTARLNTLPHGDLTLHGDSFAEFFQSGRVMVPSDPASKEAFATLAKLPFSRNDLHFVSFIDDYSTRQALMGSQARFVSAASASAAEAALRDALAPYRGGHVFVVFHSEQGMLTVRDAGGVRYQLSPERVNAIAAASNVQIFPVTCQGIYSGWGSGFAQDLDAPQVIELIVSAGRNARTQQDFVRGLAGRNCDVLIDASAFRRQGVALAKLRFHRRLLLSAPPTIGLGGAGAAGALKSRA